MPFKDPVKRAEMNRVYHKRYRSSEKGIAKEREVGRRYYYAHPERRGDFAKLAARSAVSTAIASGRLIPEGCCVCSKGPAQAHHAYGYDGEAALQVLWLCPKHHYESHRRLREQKAQQSTLPSQKGSR